MLDAEDLLVFANRAARVVQGARERWEENAVDQRGLARAAHAGDRQERAERKPDVQVLEVVLARASDLERLAIAGSALAGDRDLAFAPTDTRR